MVKETPTCARQGNPDLFAQEHRSTSYSYRLAEGGQEVAPTPPHNLRAHKFCVRARLIAIWELFTHLSSRRSAGRALAAPRLHCRRWSVSSSWVRDRILFAPRAAANRSTAYLSYICLGGPALPALWSHSTRARNDVCVRLHNSGACVSWKRRGNRETGLGTEGRTKPPANDRVWANGDKRRGSPCGESAPLCSSRPTWRKWGRVLPALSETIEWSVCEFDRIWPGVRQSGSGMGRFGGRLQPKRAVHELPEWHRARTRSPERLSRPTKAGARQAPRPRQ